MASTATIKLTTAFADETTRTVEIGPFASTATAINPQQLRGNIRTFNADISNIASLYLSDSGASCTGITAASIIATTENEINLNV